MLPMINWPIFLLFAIVPYTVAVVIPNYRWLAVYGLLWVAISTFLFAAVYSIDNGMVMVFTMISLYGIILSVFSGIVARGISLFLKSKNFSKTTTIIPLIIGFPLALVILHIPFKLHEWKERPIEKECLNNAIPVKLGGYSFYLPLAPVFTVISASPDNNEIIRFYKNSGLRYACEKSEYGRTAITSIAINFSPSTAKHSSKFCSILRSGWQGELCSKKEKNVLGYPSEVFIYDIREREDFPHLSVNRLMSLTRNIESTYDRLQNLIKNKMQEASDIEGYIRADGEYYWVSDNEEYLTPDGKPLTLACLTGENKSYVSCRTIYGLDENIYVQFAISGDASETPHRAWQQKKKLQSFLESLRKEE